MRRRATHGLGAADATPRYAGTGRVCPCSPCLAPCSSHPQLSAPARTTRYRRAQSVHTCIDWVRMPNPRSCPNPARRSGKASLACRCGRSLGLTARMRATPGSHRAGAGAALAIAAGSGGFNTLGLDADVAYAQLCASGGGAALHVEGDGGVMRTGELNSPARGTCGGVDPGAYHPPVHRLLRSRVWGGCAGTAGSRGEGQQEGRKCAVEQPIRRRSLSVRDALWHRSARTGAVQHG
jgi:hypothetical protein